MNNVQLRLDEKQYGAFYIMDGDEQVGELVASISGDTLTAHHTEVSEKAAGKGLGKMLFNELVAHARSNRLRIKPLCTYVHAQLKKNAEQYADVWSNNES